MKKQAVLLVNTGTPDSPMVVDVWRYLTRFLNDSRVISLPAIARFLLVNLVIIPFRVRKSASLYRKVWSAEGSPLRFHTERLGTALQNYLGEEFTLFTAMRYGNPSIKSVLSHIKEGGFGKLLIIPLFPQYASSTSGSVIEKVFHEISNWHCIPEVKVIDHFHDHAGFIEAEVAIVDKYVLSDYDHVLFSFHGLPLDHIALMHTEKGDMETCYQDGTTPSCRMCYAGACYQTAQLIASSAAIGLDRYSIAFQSRFSNGWTTPFTDDEIISLARRGIKKLLVVAPSFVADCLETVVELGIDYNKLFISEGGEKLTLAESLNSSSAWVKALDTIIRGAE
jgi:protoporphyrin/coproporphyrin ferrochelatase